MRGNVDGEVYRRLKLRYDAERKWVKDRKSAIFDELRSIGREREAVKSLEQLRTEYACRLDTPTTTEWRHLFNALNLEISVVDEEELQRKWERLSKAEKDDIVNFPNRLKLQTLDESADITYYGELGQGKEDMYFLFAGPFSISMSLPLEEDTIHCVGNIVSHSLEQG